MRCELFERDDGVPVLVAVPGSHLRGPSGHRHYYLVGTLVIEPEMLEMAALMQLGVLGYAQLSEPARLRVLTCMTDWALPESPDAHAAPMPGMASPDDPAVK